MAEITLAKDYFLSRLPEAEAERRMYNRVITALSRRDITMQALCEMSEKELKMVRGIGAKSLAIIALECENYIGNGSITTAVSHIPKKYCPPN